jgi:hypothetical protein
MESVELQYNTVNWQLFVNCSELSLKVVLLYNGTEYPPVPLVHAVCMKELCSNIKLLFTGITYEKYSWYIWGPCKWYLF